jgi:hypothetical protein
MELKTFFQCMPPYEIERKEVQNLFGVYNLCQLQSDNCSGIRNIVLENLHDVLSISLVTDHIDIETHAYAEYRTFVKTCVGDIFYDDVAKLVDDYVCDHTWMLESFRGKDILPLVAVSHLYIIVTYGIHSPDNRMPRVTVDRVKIHPEHQRNGCLRDTFYYLHYYRVKYPLYMKLSQEKNRYLVIEHGKCSTATKPLPLLSSSSYVGGLVQSIQRQRK